MTIPLVVNIVHSDAQNAVAESSVTPRVSLVSWDLLDGNLLEEQVAALRSTTDTFAAPPSQGRAFYVQHVSAPRVLIRVHMLDVKCTMTMVLIVLESSFEDDD